MWKAVLAGLVLVAGPMTAWTASEGQPSAFGPPGLEDDGVHLSDDGHTFRLTDAALPASTGYVIVSLTVSSDTGVTLDQEAETNGTGTPDRGYATLLDRSDRYPPSVYPTLDGHALASVNAQGEQVACCHAPGTPVGLSFGTSSSSASGELSLSAADVLRIGFLAQDWSPTDAFHARLTAQDATFSVLDVDQGTSVRFVDLVEAAEREGTNVEAFGQRLAGEPGEAHVSFPVDGTGLVAMSSTVSGQARANVSLSLPDGTQVDNGDGQRVWLSANGATGPGTVEAILEDLHAQGTTERLTDGPDGYVDARLMVADVSTSLEGFRADSDPLAPPELPDDAWTVELDTDQLPRPSGWLVAKLEASEETVVDVFFNATFSPERTPFGYAPIVVAPDGHTRIHAEETETDPPMLAVAADGQQVACCPAVELPFGSAGNWTEYSERQVHVGPETPVFVGLAVAGWGADDAVTIRARPNATHGTLTDLAISEERTGDRVEVVDLVQRARSDGTNARLGGQMLAGEAGQGHASFEASHAGLIALGYSFDGPDAAGDVVVELPNGTTVDEGPDSNVWASVHAITDPGTLELTLRDLQEPSYVDQRTASDHSFAHAVALLADVDLPVRTLETHVYATDG